MSDELQPIDPARFGDQLAAATAWEPMEAEGASFCTYRVVEISPTRYELRMTRHLSIYLVLTFVCGLASFGALLSWWLERPDHVHIAWLLLPLTAGIVFTGLGGLMFYQGRKPVVFDKQLNQYRDDRYRKLNARCGLEAQHETNLDQIGALQILTYLESEGDFYYFELNLVLQDSDRIAVTCHGSLKHLREDAAKLARFLGVPLWDGTDQQITKTLASYLGVSVRDVPAHIE